MFGGNHADEGVDDGQASDLGAEEIGLEGAAGEAVTLRSVRKEFEDVVAVDDVDLEVEAGELLVLLGPSGCGKTTTLRMIAGLETVTAGSIMIGDEDVTETLPQDRDVSMVFQNYALYPHKTVRENLAFPLGKMDVTDAEREERILDVARLLEIEELLEKDPDQLSGGQRQRVAVGRTIVREPRLFLMDEPLSNLDAKLRVQTRAQIRTLQRRLGTTTVYVTHDQEEALSIGDRIVIMNDGEIEQIGTPEAVYTEPDNEFVAGFLGEPSMNFLDVRDGALFGGDVTLADVGIEAPGDTRRIGVRPEDVVLVDTAADEPLSAPIEFEVGVVEPLGHTYEATLRRGRTRIVAQSPDFDPEADTVRVAFAVENVHAFDETGARL